MVSHGTGLANYGLIREGEKCPMLLFLVERSPLPEVLVLVSASTFGCRKDADTLAQILSKDTFDGILVSDDAAVYQGFSNAQKCWAHLLRKAIRLTLLHPENEEYRSFLDGLLSVFHKAKRFAADRRLSDAGRETIQMGFCTQSIDAEDPI